MKDSDKLILVVALGFGLVALMITRSKRATFINNGGSDNNGGQLLDGVHDVSDWSFFIGGFIKKLGF